GLGEQGFTCTGLTDHQHTARNAAAELLEFAGIAQEFDQLFHIFLGLVASGDIRKGGHYLIFTEQARLAFAECHRTAAATGAALHLAHEKHEHGDDDQDREAGDEQLHPDALLLRFDATHFHLVVVHVVHQLGIVEHRPHDFEHRTINAFAADDQSVD